MSDIDKVLEEEWRLGEDRQSVYAPQDGQKYDDWVCDCRGHIDTAQARARIIVAAPEALRLLAELGSFLGAHVRLAPDLYKEEARHLAKINALLAALREDAA